RADYLSPDTIPTTGMPKTIRALLLLLFAQALACQVIAVTLELRPALLATPLPDRLTRLFAQLQILPSFLFLAPLLHRQCRWRWLRSFAAFYGFALAVEIAGAKFGFLFGSYTFTDVLGFRLFGLVPALIPLAWFNISMPAFAVASLILPRRVELVVG